MKINTVYTSNKPNYGACFKGSKNTPLEGSAKKVEMKINQKEANGILKSAKRFVGYSIAGLSVLFGGHCATSVIEDQVPHQIIQNNIVDHKLGEAYVIKDGKMPIYNEVDQSVKKSIQFLKKVADHAILDLKNALSIAENKPNKQSNVFKNERMDAIQSDYSQKVEKLLIEAEVESNPRAVAQKIIEEKIADSPYGFKDAKCSTQINRPQIEAIREGNISKMEHFARLRALFADSTMQVMGRMIGEDAYWVIRQTVDKYKLGDFPLAVLPTIFNHENGDKPTTFEFAQITDDTMGALPSRSMVSSGRGNVEAGTFLFAKVKMNAVNNDVYKAILAYREGEGNVDTKNIKGRFSTEAEKYAALSYYTAVEGPIEVQAFLSPYRFDKKKLVEATFSHRILQKMKKVNFEFKSEFLPTSEKLFSSKEFNYSFEKSVDATIKTLRKMR